MSSILHRNVGVLHDFGKLRQIGLERSASNSSGVLSRPARWRCRRRRSRTSGSLQRLGGLRWILTTIVVRRLRPARTSPASSTIRSPGRRFPRWSARRAAPASASAPATASARIVPASMMRARRRQRHDRDLHLAGDQRGVDRARRPCRGSAWMSTPAACLNISMVRCSGLPTPVDAVVEAAGLGLGERDQLLDAWSSPAAWGSPPAPAGTRRAASPG